MIWMSRIGGLLLGVAVGAGGLWSTRTTAASPSADVPQTVAAERIQAAPECNGDQALLRQLQHLREQVSDAQLTATFAEAQLVAEIGAPMDMPQDLPEAFTEAGLERNLNALLDELDGGEIAGIDCGEYPCTGVIVLTGPDAFDLRDAFDVAMDDGVYANYHKSGGVQFTDDNQIKGLILRLAFPVGKPAEENWKRIGFRMDESTETFKSEIETLLNEP